MFRHLDYVFLVYGFSFIFMGVTIWIGRWRTRGDMPWQWLAAFGVLHGCNEWLDMLALGLGDSPAFQVVRLAIMAGSYVLLVEFGRRGWRAGGGQAAGWWIHAVLIGAALLGLTAGLSGLNAACRYALALPGSLLTGWILLRASRTWPSEQRRWLQLVGLALMMYGPAAGLVVPRADFFPATVLNHESFLSATGFPIQVFRALCAVAAALGMRMSCGALPATGWQSRYRRLLVPLALTILLVGGWWASNWRGETADREMRDAILGQASAVARTINPERVRALSFTEEDKTNPAFRRLRNQLILAGYAMRQSCIYSMAIRNNSLVFGPDNLDKDDPRASRPGTVYQEPTEQDWVALRTGEPCTHGPSRDEYGVFVSAFAPLRDPVSNEVLMTVGVDVAAEDWDLQLSRQRLAPILFTLVLVVLVMIGGGILEWREQAASSRGWLRYAEVMLTAACGLVLTVAAALAAHDQETRARRLMFSQVANANTASFGEVLRDLRDFQLAGLARFLECSEEVTRDEFHRYAGDLATSAATRAFEWIPRVPAADKGRIEASARREGLDGFTVFEVDDRGVKSHAAGRHEFYPVFYAEPQTGNEGAVGFDLGCERARRVALEEAASTRLPVATDPVALVQESGTRKGVLFFQAVFPIQEPRVGQDGDVFITSPRGFVLAVLELQTAIDHALTHLDQTNPVVRVVVSQINRDREPERLACWPPQEEPHAASAKCENWGESGLSRVFPLFICGKTYAITVLPGTAFLAAHAPRAGRLAVLVGLVLVAVTSGVVAFVSRRQAVLEEEVLRRSAELRELQRAKEALRHSEEKHRALYESSADAILTMGPPDWVFTAANPAAVRLLGAKDESELLRFGLADVSPVHQGDGEFSCVKAVKMIEAAMEAGSHFFEWKHKRFDGTGFAATILLTRVNIEGRLLLQATIRDVSTLKQAEEAMRTSEERFRTLVANIPGVVFRSEVNPPWRVHYCSEVALALTGYSAADFARGIRSYSGVVHPDDLSAVMQIVAQAVADHRPFTIEHRICHADGCTRWVYARGQAIYDAGGTPLWLDGVIMDITDRKRAEEALLASAEKVRAIVENLGIGVAMISPDMKVMEMNRQMRAWFPEVDPAKTPICCRSFCNPADEGACMSCPTRRTLRDGQVHEEVKTTCMEGSDRIFRIATSAVRDAEGEVVAAIRMMEDITERQRAEEALRKSEERLRLAQRAASVGIWDWDIATGQLDWTPELEQLYGYEPGTFPGSYAGFSDRVHHNDLAGIERQRQAAVAAHQPFDFDFRVRRPSGEIRWINCKGAARYDAAGWPYRLFGVNVDITERKQAEEALRQRAEEVERLLEAVPAAVWVAHDSQCLRITGNRRANELLEAQEGENVSATTKSEVRRFFTPDGHEIPAEEMPIQKAVATNRDVRDIELHVQVPSGRRIAMLGSAVPLRDQAGNARGCIGVFLDITERKRAEERLGLLGAAIEAVANAVVITDPEGTISWVNPAFTQLTGYAAEEAIGQNPRILKSGQHDLSFYQELWETITSGNVWRGEMVNRRKDGRLYTESMTITPIRDDRGSTTHFVGIKEDITSRKLAEALELERTSLKQSIASMEQVLGVVGHELRTPLAGIRAMAEFLLLPGSERTSEYGEFLKAINSEIARMAETVNDLLEAARLTSGTARWNWSTFSVADACQEAIDTMCHLVDPGLVTLSLAVEPPDATMAGDRAAVRRLVLNLVNNSQKHTSSGAISVETRPWRDELGEWVEIVVRDTGEGMSPQIAAKLGEAFALNSGVVGDLFVKGAGLGLAICKGIVGAHGGSMHVQSEVGKGTTVTVHLRADLPEPSGDPEAVEIVRSIRS